VFSAIVVSLELLQGLKPLHFSLRIGTTEVMPCYKTQFTRCRDSAHRSRLILFPVPCSLFPVPCSLFPVPCSLFHSAAAPLTISMISLVMAAWRTRFIFSVSESIISEALFVAESIAVIRAACSAATDSVIAW
jgi:hypothetical protein